MIYRLATSDDAAEIASLHARSWQLAYKGMLSDDFLTNHVVADRQQLWNKRLMSPSQDQYVMVCHESELLLGFVCMFLNHDDQYGALLDNLHVAPGQQRRGIGQQLMRNAMRYLLEHDTPHGMFLWVFEQNANAVKFYEKLGGQLMEKQPYSGIGETAVPAFRVVWQQDSLRANSVQL